jgi:hypothetical protein
VKFSPQFRLAAKLEFEQAASAYEAARDGLGQRFIDAVDEALAHTCEAPHRYKRELADVQRVRVPLSIHNLLSRAS